jgi:hypothetical protein
MSAGTNAFPSRAGFNQSGGAYFMSLAALSGATNAASNAVSPWASVLVNAGSNSGGAYSNPTFALASATSIFAPTSANAGTFASNVMNTQNLLLKDMGRTVVSSGRSFRKFAPVVNYSNGISTFGVAGQAATTGEDYLTGYIELGFEGNGTPAPVAHFGR